MLRRGVVLVLVAVMAGCSSAPTTNGQDGGGTKDAGAHDGGGTTDAGVTDGGGTTDAGTTDAGTTDAGTTDAGTTDAGTTDAGTTDAGTTDGGGTTDAGTTDAGATDGGTGPTTYTVGGTVTGLPGPAVLSDNGTDTVTVGGDGSFTFPTALVDGASYSVSVEVQPAGGLCVVRAGTASGTIAGADVTSVRVDCSAFLPARHGLAATDDGSAFILAGNLWTFGTSDYGLLGNGTQTGVAPLRGNADTPEEVQLPAGLTAVDVAGGQRHLLVLTRFGTVYGLGSDGFGALGLGTLTNQNPWPVAIPGLPTIQQVTAGLDFSVVLATDGSVWGFGQNGSGQLGNGGWSANDTATAADLSMLPPGVVPVAVAAGDDYTVLLASDGTVWTAGDNAYGQLGRPTSSSWDPSFGEVEAAGGGGAAQTGIVGIAAGGYQALLVDVYGNVLAMGANGHGQIGDGSGMDQSRPVPVPFTGVSGNTAAVAIAAGYRTSFAVTAGGVALGWGEDANGALGTGGTPTQVSTPATIDLSAVPAGRTVVEIGCGRYHTLMADDAGQVYASGQDTLGALGDGRETNSPLFVPVSGPTGRMPVDLFVARDAASPATFVRYDDDQLWAFGRHQADLGTDHQGGTPGLMTLLATHTIVKVVGSSGHYLALDSNGQVWAWGVNDYGQAGDGTTVNPITTPVQAAIGVPVQDIAAGRAFSVALDGSGEVWAWGKDLYGQLGNGQDDNLPHALPGHVFDQDGLTPLGNCVQVAAGESFGLARTATGYIYTWGLNSDNQLGRPTPMTDPANICSANACGHLSGPVCASNTTPTNCIPQQQFFNGFTGMMAAGAAHVIAIAGPTNVVYAWGRDDWGQVGNPSAQNAQMIPMLVQPPTGKSALDQVAEVSAGFAFSMARTSTGQVYTWGLEDSGQLGIPKASALGCGASNDLCSPQPLAILSSVTVTHIGAGGDFAAAIDAQGDVYTWGQTADGRLGHDGPDGCIAGGTCAFVPQPVILMPH